MPTHYNNPKDLTRTDLLVLRHVFLVVFVVLFVGSVLSSCSVYLSVILSRPEGVLEE